MSGVKLARLYRIDSYADADVVIRLAAGGSNTVDGSNLDLACFPAHRAILCSGSEFFRSKADNWHISSARSSSSRSSMSTDDNNSIVEVTVTVRPSTCPLPRPQFILEIDSTDHQATAEAVIAALYGVTDPLALLTDQHLLHAVIIADRIQATAPAAEAMQMLEKAMQSEQGASEALLQQLISLAAWPSCLLPLLPLAMKGSSWYKQQQKGQPASGTAAASTAPAAPAAPAAQAAPAAPAAPAASAAGNQANSNTDTSSSTATKQMLQLLLSLLGDLEAVWGDPELSTVLLALPLPALQLLLSSNQLKAASEDTVLFTVEKYAKHNSLPEADAVLLAAVVRVPQLSDSWLLGLATTSATAALLITRCYGPLLRQLLPLVVLTDPAALLAEVPKALPTAPASWALGPRVIKQPAFEGVEVVWQLPVSELKAAFEKCTASSREVVVHGPTSAPLSGLAWRPSVICTWQAGVGGAPDGVQLGVRVGPVDAPADVFYRFKSSLAAPSYPHAPAVGVSSALLGFKVWGWTDFFALGPITGGWEGAVIAASGRGKQLPAAGELKLVAKVHKVLQSYSVFDGVLPLRAGSGAFVFEAKRVGAKK